MDAVHSVENGVMVIRGRIQNGVVVLCDDVSLPEGTEVTVVVCAVPEAAHETISQERHRRLTESFQRIAWLPIEG